jgi:cell filamentation protein
VTDPYVYPGTSVLKNRAGYKDAEKLNQFERRRTKDRLRDPLPNGRLDVAHLKAIHRHLFQDVYEWAGTIRTLDIAKGNSYFCRASFIEQELERLTKSLMDEKYLCDISREKFVERSAHYLSELNAIHPFREGNGRTQRLFIQEVARRAGHRLDLTKMDEKEMLNASIRSMNGDEKPMIDVIARALEPERTATRVRDTVRPAYPKAKSKDRDGGRGERS